MKTTNFLKKVKRIHFIGIGGISMSGLAKYCLEQKIEVSGSDKVYSSIIKKLEKAGAKVYIGHNANNVCGADLVVYSSSISYDNEEFIYASNNNIPLIKRATLLENVFAKYKNRIAVCGCHGKTTTTCMISYALEFAKKRFCMFLGGEDKKFSNYKRTTGNDYCVIEACEYKKNFLEFNPTVAVITNVDNDHVESYGSFENIVEAFNLFASGKIAVINADDKNSLKIVSDTKITYGIVNNASVMAKRIKESETGISFSVYYYNVNLGRINLKVKGIYNVYNALASICTLLSLGIDFTCIKGGLEKFNGVKRRQEYIGEYNGKKVICDYAHHPSEINQLLSGFDSEKTLVVFQPHTFSRTKNLLEEFTNTFKAYKNLIIYKTYPAREKYCYSGSGYRLYKNLKSETAKYCKNQKALFEMLNDKMLYKNTKIILVIGAGNIYETIGKKIK